MRICRWVYVVWRLSEGDDDAVLWKSGNRGGGMRRGDVLRSNHGNADGPVLQVVV